MDYGYKPTTNGRALIAKCMALEVPLVLTRVAFGSGLVLESTDLADVHELINYIADGSIGDRSHQDNRFRFVVQYDNSTHPDVPTFYMNEFIVYGRDPETAEDVDLLYATLGDYKQPVPAYSASIPASVWKFPVELIVSDEILVSVDAPAGLVTYDDLQKTVDKSVKALAANAGSAIVIEDFTIPAKGWALHGFAEPGYVEYPYRIDVVVDGCTVKHFPVMAIDLASQSIAGTAGMAATAETFEGYISFWAKNIPSADLTGSLQLTTEKAEYSGGGCDCPGTATDEEVKDEVDGIFGDTGTDTAPDEDDSTGDGPTEDDIPDGYTVATDEEVHSMNKDIFG